MNYSATYENSRNSSNEQFSINRADNIQNSIVVIRHIWLTVTIRKTMRKFLLLIYSFYHKIWSRSDWPLVSPLLMVEKLYLQIFLYLFPMVMLVLLTYQETDSIFSMGGDMRHVKLTLLQVVYIASLPSMIMLFVDSVKMRNYKILI